MDIPFVRLKEKKITIAGIMLRGKQLAAEDDKEFSSLLKMLSLAENRIKELSSK